MEIGYHRIFSWRQVLWDESISVDFVPVDNFVGCLNDVELGVLGGIHFVEMLRGIKIGCSVSSTPRASFLGRYRSVVGGE